MDQPKKITGETPADSVGRDELHHKELRYLVEYDDHRGEYEVTVFTQKGLQ
jgi:hypothetical protein